MFLVVDLTCLFKEIGDACIRGMWTRNSRWKWLYREIFSYASACLLERPNAFYLLLSTFTYVHLLLLS